MSLEPMVVTAYSDENFNAQVGQPFKVWINPSTYTHTYAIEYRDRQAQGAPGPSAEFSKVGQDTVAFDLIFDTTGVVSPPKGAPAAASDGVAGLVDTFSTLTAKVNGSIHRPNFIKLAWAQLQFQCILTSMNVVYTLFKPDGTPIRATVSVTFLGFHSEKQLAKAANKQSPDLTHVVTVQAGDTLPALCYRIYGSAVHYAKVAESNGLAGFRALRPGSRLVFPPLSGAPP
jgi:nucleoid-associated protein YgaU